MGEQFGNKAWLFRNLLVRNPLLEESVPGQSRRVSSELVAKFKPDLTPEQMDLMGGSSGVEYTRETLRRTTSSKLMLP